MTPTKPAPPPRTMSLLDELSAYLNDEEADLMQPAPQRAATAPTTTTDDEADDGMSLADALDALPLTDAPTQPDADPLPATAPATPSAPPARTKRNRQSPEPFSAGEVVELATVRQQRSNARADLVVEALHGSRECVGVIRDAFANGTADYDDAVKALPQLHKVIEHVEKIEAARSVRPNLPRIMFESKNGTFSFAVLPEDHGGGTRLLDSDTSDE